jgi:Flp pilus assembly secretin CpaC
MDGNQGAGNMKAVISKIGLAATLLLSVIAAAHAEDRTIGLSLGVPSRLLLDKVFETVLIGDADIVGVYPDDDNSVILEPLSPGVTNLVFVDDRHIAIANIRIAVCERSTKADSSARPAATGGSEPARRCGSEP